ncbi:ribonuclease HII [Staphylococcus agnetis]|uniref:ribonuclease HII n=1 Tax=Staphylococcus agnetis TaxID=985762 RepID=UPI000DF9DA97|nr:ribonuclease HII [Staphylococcus agnetis]SUK15069.1 ribonuclease HII [Staphylococcus agnetis]
MTVKTIKDIEKELLEIMSLEELERHPSYHDSRKGVQKAFTRQRKYIQKQLQMQQDYEAMCKYENEILKNHPHAIICGIDEVGRGPLAGPVIASAVVLEHNHNYIGINDSKKLNKLTRDELNRTLQSNVTSWAIGSASPEEIDKLNIYEATKLAMYRAIQNLDVEPTHYLIDAMHLEDVTEPQTSIIKGDAKSVSIAAASIIAKVYRDNLMEDYHDHYPHYDFHNNAGYGTKKHLEGLKYYGVTPIHRKTFEPIKSLLS